VSPPRPRKLAALASLRARHLRAQPLSGRISATPESNHGSLFFFFFLVRFFSLGFFCMQVASMRTRRPCADSTRTPHATQSTSAAQRSGRKEIQGDRLVAHLAQLLEDRLLHAALFEVDAGTIDDLLDDCLVDTADSRVRHDAYRRTPLRNGLVVKGSLTCLSSFGWV
jgi:hypothetical protein